MGRRSPANERYQRHTMPAGKTRKSAAAAKPVRSGKSSGSSSSSKSSKSRKPAERTRGYVHPTTPEYKRTRLVWWGFLGIAIALSSVSWLLWRAETLRTYGNVVLVIAYASIAAAIYIDWSRLRPMRQAWIASGREAAIAADAQAAKDAAKGKITAAKAEKSKPAEKPADTAESSLADEKS